MFDQIVEEYKSIAFSNVLDFVDIVDGKLLFKKNDAEDYGAISELQEMVYKNGKRSIKIKLHNKNTALKALMKLCSKCDDTKISAKQLLSLTPDAVRKITEELKTYI